MIVGGLVPWKADLRVFILICALWRSVRAGDRDERVM